jgi:hypothetical protein
MVNSQPAVNLEPRWSFSTGTLIGINKCDVNKQIAEFEKRTESPQWIVLVF